MNLMKSDAFCMYWQEATQIIVSCVTLVQFSKCVKWFLDLFFTKDFIPPIKNVVILVSIVGLLGFCSVRNNIV